MELNTEYFGLTRVMRKHGSSGLSDFARGDRDRGDLIDGERCLLEEVAILR